MLFPEQNVDVDKDENWILIWLNPKNRNLIIYLKTIMVLVIFLSMLRSFYTICLIADIKYYVGKKCNHSSLENKASLQRNQSFPVNYHNKEFTKSMLLEEVNHHYFQEFVKKN